MGVKVLETISKDRKEFIRYFHYLKAEIDRESQIIYAQDKAIEKTDKKWKKVVAKKDVLIADITAEKDAIIADNAEKDAIIAELRSKLNGDN